MKKTHVPKMLAMVSFLFLAASTFADIALPKSDKQDTKYYFANVDSFPGYTFYVKKTVNNNTYRIKQDAAFLLKAGEGEQSLEVWAIDKKDKKQSNTFLLNVVKPSQQYGGNVAYIAIQFTFDKNGKLNYKQTILKPDCYSNKKQSIPVWIGNHSCNDGLGWMPVYALLALLSLWGINRLKLRNVAYV